ncbi:carbohydrate ABC transporter permease [Spirochaeta cellobiosiphila]|uniref:carbohydrate ABC transporter permease n=1 Tax=Spirochaeta cellobiosiphila TaxID=504483 RepID=UPI00042177D2|nr:carbohydrate ABC transporter permease [Spirochaeta cellobiosiphila]
MTNDLNPSQRKRNSYYKLILGTVVSLMMVFPIYAVIIAGFKTNGQILADPFGLPSPFTLDAYRMILGKSAQFWNFLYNSVFIAFIENVIVIVLSMTAGIALTKLRFKGRLFIYNFFLMGMLFPLTVAVLPLYLQMRNLGLLGSRLGVILAEGAFAFPLSIFIFSGFFRDIPNELHEACKIDGGTIFTFLFKIVIPISTSVIATVAIITFIQSWNQFLLPLLVLNEARQFTIPMGIMQFQGQFSTGWNQIMAFISLSIIPMAIFYFAAQKFIVAGLTAGSVKG